MPTLRSTPERVAFDRNVFPELAKSQRLTRCPSYSSVRLGRSRSTVMVDAFFVPGDLERRLDAIYRAYLDWWVTKGSPQRKRFPRHGLVVPCFRDYIHLTVLREHVEWWIALLEACAPFVYNDFRWRNREFHSNGDGGYAVAYQRWHAIVDVDPIQP